MKESVILTTANPRVLLNPEIVLPAPMKIITNAKFLDNVFTLHCAVMAIANANMVKMKKTVLKNTKTMQGRRQPISARIF